MNVLKYKKFSRNDSPKFEICTLIISLIFVIILPYLVEAGNNNNKIRGNMFYVQVLNYAMPAVKATSFSEDDMAESSFLSNSFPLNIFNINTRNPLSILGKEAAFLGINTSSEINNSNIDEFKLDNKQIAKNGDNSNLSRGNNSNSPADKVSVFDPSLKRKMNKEKPDVLIYHTHTTESYKPGDPNSFDDTQNVVSVGDKLISELNKYGISGINDRTVHDAEAYNRSYDRSAITLGKYLKKYGDFKLIIDIHRDSIEDKNAVTMNINGESIANYMMVMSRNNPHFSKNMALANQILQVSNQLYPGFAKGVLYYNHGIRNFNQGMSNNAILIEVGSDINTTTEAQASMKYLARIIAQVIK
ncbi:stage II sporulation protein P [Clostridium tyrobutyricum]|uniref:stage II sporulation protein P n=1 Tax=Clostridium tyrobutyricum TaxID=1519 RepID=UPI00035C0F09|nr:stage II sporulation protein P [Clostridium tyrobutyricum]ANP69505.1 stage II sporulation protein P [Clostridium tyrobutyricum]